MAQGNLLVVETGRDSASVSGKVKDTACLLAIDMQAMIGRTESAERFNVPSFNFRDYNRSYWDFPGIVCGALVVVPPPSFITWNPGPGQLAIDVIDTMYNDTCVHLMLRF